MYLEELNLSELKIQEFPEGIEKLGNIQNYPNELEERRIIHNP